MLNPLFDIAPLQDLLDEGPQVITANLRLSRNINDAWSRHQAARGASRWAAPAIMPLESWLQSCWLTLVDAAYPPALAGAVASHAQELLAWEQVIDGDTALNPEINPANYVQLAHGGWRLIRQWQLDVSRLKGHEHPGARLLARWGQAVEATLAERSLISSDQRNEIVMDGFREGALPAVPRLVTVGFQTLPPLIKELMSLAATDITPYNPAPTQSRCQLFGADHFNAELAAAAVWAKSTAEHNPEARIGIVIPSLTSERARVERIFRNHFDPAWPLPDRSYSPPPFNISAGTPLSEAPVVASALALLHLLCNRTSVHQLCNLLHSVHWGDCDSEGATRSACQAKLLDTGLHHVPTARLRQLFQDIAIDPKTGDNTNQVSQRLADLATLQRRWLRVQSFAAWRDAFEQSLDTLGWPGSRSPDSLEYQQMEHWGALLDSFAQLDRIAPPADLEVALHRLSGLASDTVFHAESPDTQVQILGTLEATGLRFDYLWVMSLDDRHWPEPTAPHPLLPIALQRQLGMPRACPERELALAQERFDLFKSSAPAVVFSYARHEGDIAIQPSVLVAGLPGSDIDPAETHPWWSPIHASRKLDMVRDDRGPAFVSRDGRLPGGSRFIADQAQSPFNAFATWRLDARPLPEPGTGLSPMLRGILVHGCLERFWRQTGSSRALEALEETDLRVRLRGAIDEEVTDFFRHQHGAITRDDLGSRLIALEQERLLDLLSAWLSVERERPPFTVESLEVNAAVELAGLTVRLRLDRIDRLEDGHLAIIDYKTGQTTISNIAGERLIEPQLPLYALTQETPPTLVTYALVNPRRLGFDGVADNDTRIAGCKSLIQRELPETWPDTLDRWRQSLEALVNELSGGEAVVCFYSRQALDYGGHLEPLNRWPERERILQYLNEGVPGP